MNSFELFQDQLKSSFKFIFEDFGIIVPQFPPRVYLRHGMEIVL